MRLDITIHRKGTPYGEDYWVNGRIRYASVKKLMVEKYQYKYGEDLLLTKGMIIDLLDITHKLLIEADESDMMEYANFYTDLLYVYNKMIRKNEDWYFEATW